MSVATSAAPLFQALVERDLERLRPALRKPTAPLPESVRHLSDLADQRSIATSHKKYVDCAVKQVITTHGVAAWSADVDPEARKLLEARGFLGNRLSLATGSRPVGMRIEPMIDPVRAFATYGPRAGKWKLEDAANTLRYLNENGAITALVPGTLEVNGADPIANYALMPPHRRGPTGSDVDLTGSPKSVRGPIDISKLGDYLDYRDHLGRKIKSLETGMEPHKESVRLHLMLSGNVDDTVVSSPDAEGWRLIAKPSILVDPVRLVHTMNADIAKAVGTVREDGTRKVWENLSYQVDQDWVKQQEKWQATVHGPAEASYIMIPVKTAKGSKAS